MNIVCLEKVSSVAIDKTDGVVVTLPNSSLDSKIVASKSSEMNVSFPDDNGEMVEFPIPEQYVHQINPTKSGVTADISDLYSH
jgi:adenylyl cyclase-associated protein